MSAAAPDPHRDPEEEARAALERDVVHDASGLAGIRVTGSDAASFLQGQLTCDVAAVPVPGSCLAAWCSPKGRALVVVRAVRLAEGWLLVVPRSRVAATMKRLGLFVLRADVRLAEAGTPGPLVGLSGPGADALLRACALEVPPEVGGVSAADAAVVVRLPGPAPRFLVAGDAGAVAAVRASLREHAQPVGPGAWSLLDVRAGVAGLADAGADEFLPQMLNLDLLGGVSFTKGCFVGQEIVARTQHLGRLKRRMYRLGIPRDAEPAPGDPVYPGDPEPAESAGRLVEVAPAPGGGAEALAVLRIDAVLAGELRLRSVLGPALELLPLPYDA